MNHTSPTTETFSDTRSHARRDTGSSFIEILVAVVLMGTVVIAVVAALQVTIIATRIERDHAKAYQWLQSANGVLQAKPRVGCDLDPILDTAFTTGEQKVRLSYQDIVRTEVVNPPGWSDLQLTVIEPVKIWDGSQYLDPSTAPKDCYDADGYLLQLVEIQVTNPDGDIIESLQVVKRD